MFTIKVTYRGQIRKHTFTDTDTFPSYDQICTQLCRVFPIVHTFYLSKLLFSPNAAHASNILIGKEVHNSLDYNKCIRPYKDRSWPLGLLRFNICDARVSPMNVSPKYPIISIDPLPSRPTNLSRESSRLNPFGLSAVPPIAPSTFPDAMDVDRSNIRHRPQSRPLPTPQHRSSAPNLGACCSVAQGKADIQTMLTNFEENLNRVLETNLGTPMSSDARRIPSDLRTSTSGRRFNSAPPASLCSVCTKNVSDSERGPDSWYSCTNCHVIVCDSCHHAERPGFCLSTMGLHNMQQGAASIGGNAYLPIPHLPDPWTSRGSSTNSASIPVAAPSSTPAQHASADGTSPVIHAGVICDVCDATIEGVRHKCLDCPDYDLCTSCISTGAAEAHNPFHEFFEITKPGRVIVHTVFSGDGEMEAGRRATRNSAHRSPAAPVPQEPVTHLATCDLCDSRIIGDRYKCLGCPDYDTCSSCFSITKEQHPDHPFVRIQKPEDYIRRRNNPYQTHYATCDGCENTIKGTRYKCMHPQCPDYDLCEKCEALPIPVHPSIHPMLKMKTPDTVVPTVYRVGQTKLIDQPTWPTMVPEIPVVRTPHEPHKSPLAATHVEEERISTPKPWVPTPPIAQDSQEPVREASPMKPPVPPKPEMMSNPSWASIPSFFGSANFDPMYNVSGNFLNPFADIPAPPSHAPPTMPFGFARSESQGLEKSRADVKAEERDTTLPSVPNHIPNPWPTTNPAERQELFQLIADFAGPSTSANIISSLSNAPRRVPRRPRSPEEAPFSYQAPTPMIPAPAHGSSYQPAYFMPPTPRAPTPEARTPEEDPEPSATKSLLIMDVSSPESSIYAHTPKEEAPLAAKDSTKESQVPEYLPIHPTTSEFFNSLYQTIEDTVTSARATEAENNTQKPPPVAAQESTTQVESQATKPTTPGHTAFGDFSVSMSHLLRELEKFSPVLADRPETSMANAAAPVAEKAESVAESSISREALLNAPEEKPAESNRRAPLSLFDLIVPQFIPNAGDKPATEGITEPIRIPLSAAFVEDVTVPDGQVFPPGAEFVKCWRLLNDSGHDWPESTELVFVAGEALSAQSSAAMSVELGKVAAGAEIDVWTGELKAPDAPGRYVGYWRLKADNELFGNSLWIEINVMEADLHHSSDESLAASSIIMPGGSSMQPSEHIPSVTAHTASITVSGVSTEDNISDAGSDISMISIPSSPSDDEDEELWHDSRSQTTAERAALAAAAAATKAGSPGASASAMDYVLLYDDNSSSEEEK